MCGIAGFAGGQGDRDTRLASLTRMCDAIRHRGPDDWGAFVDQDAAIGMRRLSIIDVAGGHQPIANEAGDVQIVFNGEIYNHRALQQRLANAGHRFATHSDTEAIVHCYEDRGDDCVHELRGMFAFAIWDTRQSRLLIARDRLGIKPLYYLERNGTLLFASELRALLAFDPSLGVVEPAAVASYLALGYVPDPQSIFAGVRKLPPGHLLSWTRDGGVQVRRYWRPPDEERAITHDEAVEELRRLLDDAVSSHLESEVPLGAFLSGGVDSSTVVSIMARHMAERPKTFCIGFDEDAYDESADARAVAEAIGTEHHELRVHPDADTLIEELIRAFDEPFADASALPTYLVSQLAREHVTVALSGDGGDELFGGYRRYRHALDARILPAWLRPVATGLGRALPHAAPGRGRLLDLGRPALGRYATTVAVPLHEREGGVAREETAMHLPQFATLLEPSFAEAAHRDLATRFMRVDLETYLPGDILTKVDRMTMAVSLEARVPLLDHPLVEFAVSLPSSSKMGGAQGKRVLRDAIMGVVPNRVLTKRKHGFGVPLDRWFRGPLQHRLESLARGGSRIEPYVIPSAVGRLVREHGARRRDHAMMLWRLLVLELWLEQLQGGALASASFRTQALDTIVARARRVDGLSV